MRNRFIKVPVAVFAGIMSLTMAFPANAVSWVGTGLHYKAYRDKKDFYTSSNGATEKNLGTEIYGWVKGDNGYWYYCDPATGYRQTGWASIDKDIYYFLPTDGRMVTGWQFIGRYWYYFSAYGTLQTGWIQLDGYTYYCDPTYGYALSGTHVVDSERFDFAEADNPYGVPECSLIETPDSVADKAPKKDTTADDLALKKGLLDRINTLRKKKGLPTLVLNQQLEQAAAVRGTELKTLYSHVNKNGKDFDTAVTETGYNWSNLAECIDRGMNKSDETVFNEWLDGEDSGNILSNKYRDIGIYVTRDGTDIYYEVLLGSVVPQGMRVKTETS